MNGITKRKNEEDGAKKNSNFPSTRNTDQYYEARNVANEVAALTKKKEETEPTSLAIPSFQEWKKNYVKNTAENDGAVLTGQLSTDISENGTGTSSATTSASTVESATVTDPVTEAMNKILNREKFSYDMDADALYQQYKNKYITQGKLAMEDTMGKAASLTGGYGNSYAQMAGQAAYNEQLNNLNDVVPDLYNLAYSKYQNEGDELTQNYNILANAYGSTSDTTDTESPLSVTDFNKIKSTLDGSKYADDEDSVVSYLDSLTDSGTITEKQADSLYDYWKSGSHPVADEAWKAVKDMSTANDVATYLTALIVKGTITQKEAEAYLQQWKDINE